MRIRVSTLRQLVREALVMEAGGEKSSFNGISLKIDRPKGFVQKGKDKDGEPWTRTYKFDYGYIPRTEGGDDEELDVFVGNDENAPVAYWATQLDAEGEFDEFKVFLGFPTEAAAKAAYLAHIPAEYLDEIFEMPITAMQSMFGAEITGDT